jgi:bifunctional non-homologous end joining protein LigD
MPLAEYHRKRKFEETPEPAGTERAAPAATARFVVQMHDASHLHYDFRLEVDGVLVSWAVPKGPSMNPAEKRLAMMTEDHPLEYAGFEGVIPEGNYGAGTVMVWDNGTWEPEGSKTARQQLDDGELKFTLHGARLRGSFVLVRTRWGAKAGKSWLLIKHRDPDADLGFDIDSLAWSVLSRRTMRQIAEG